MKKRDDFYIAEIIDRIELIERYLKGLSRPRFLKSYLHRSAVVRELEVIGEAAKAVSQESKDKFPQIPWKQMSAMRNRLIHGYFDVDYSIVWDVAKTQLSPLKETLAEAAHTQAPKVHSWRMCPLGQYYVRAHKRKVQISKAHPDGRTAVRPQCRHNPSGKDQIYPDEIELISAAHSSIGTLGAVNDRANSDAYDPLIRLWTQYWNEVLKPTDPLQPEIVKALIWSESKFKLDAKVKMGPRNFARGLAQVTDATRDILRNESGELKDHYVNATDKEIAIPSVAICASIRWLFRKQETASSFLRRNATWEESVAEYKACLRTSTRPFQEKGMIDFMKAIADISGRNAPKQTIQRKRTK